MTISAYDPKLIHPLFPRACSVLTRSETEGAGGALFALVEIVLTTSDPDNYITLDGTYPVKQEVKRRQRLYCHGGEHRFSETAYSSLFGRHGSFKEYVQTAKMTAHGLSTEQIADVKEARWKNHLGMAESLGTKVSKLSSSFMHLNRINVDIDPIG